MNKLVLALAFELAHTHIVWHSRQLLEALSGKRSVQMLCKGSAVELAAALHGGIVAHTHMHLNFHLRVVGTVALRSNTAKLHNDAGAKTLVNACTNTLRQVTVAHIKDLVGSQFAIKALLNASHNPIAELVRNCAHIRTCSRLSDLQAPA